MQDTYYLDLDFGGRGWAFGGVYDGHGGDYAARYAAKNLHYIFLHNYLSGMTPDQAFTESYETVSTQLAEQESGTTAANFLIAGHEIVTANVGDSRVIIVSNSGFSQLTVDHRLNNKEELRRVIAAGASIGYPYVMRGSQGIMTTRSIGDAYFSPAGIISTPFIHHYTLSDDDLALVVASDGLWDTMTNREVADQVRKYRDVDDLLAALTEEVTVHRGGTDNLTILGVSFP
jgi:serine/threonine protein phosphatase PrpC